MLSNQLSKAPLLPCGLALIERALVFLPANIALGVPALDRVNAKDNDDEGGGEAQLHFCH